MKVFHLKEQFCPKCGKKLDAATPVGHDGGPKPGDVTVCIECHSVLEFGSDLDVKVRSMDGLSLKTRQTLERIIFAMKQVKKWN